MGLDMYATTIRKHPGTEVDFKLGRVEAAQYIADEAFDCQELHYWRKHPNLHGWIEALYRSKGGMGDEFNCNTVLLTTEDLDALEAAVNEGNLPPTSGFFFGQSDGSEKDDDLEFIRKARDAIAAGLFVYYESWW